VSGAPIANVTRALEAAIADNSDDPEPYLVLADALQERGDPRGESQPRPIGGATTQFYYGTREDDYRVTAVRVPDGTLVELDYDDRGRLARMRRGATTLYVATDLVGTPRIVVDTSGTIVKRVDRDAFGALVADSAPGIDVPIGFGGGIADSTGLVRLGLRDYDPEIGGFLGADPMQFRSGTFNLYAYASNDPIGKREVAGAWSVKMSGCSGACAGLKVSYRDGKWSTCAEAGIGIGGSIEVDPSAAADPQHMYLKAEAKVKFPLGAVGFEAKLCEDRSSKVEPVVELPGFKARGKDSRSGKVGTEVGLDPETGKPKDILKPLLPKPPKPGQSSVGFEGKALVGSCLTF
jgi:RHS repeat-associated protein/uncharacterized protein (TIGR02996 family)